MSVWLLESRHSVHPIENCWGQRAKQRACTLVAVEGMTFDKYLNTRPKKLANIGKTKGA